MLVPLLCVDIVTNSRKHLASCCCIRCGILFTVLLFVLFGSMPWLGDEIIFFVSMIVGIINGNAISVCC